MPYIDDQLLALKTLFEAKIRENGKKGKTSAIRSSALINIIHDSVKHELIQQRVDPTRIKPKLGKTSGESQLSGYYKQKKQDVCVEPKRIRKSKRTISWGPMASEKLEDKYGEEYTQNTLVINIRSQLSSIAKNTDTLFERTLAEALNLHKKYPDIVLGEVYLIPTHEYDESTMDDEREDHRIAFKEGHTNIAKYISFFKELSERKKDPNDPSKYEACKYERCALLVVDFNRDQPYLYRSTAELKAANLVPADFDIELADLSFDSFAEDILRIYGERFELQNLLVDPE